MLFCSARADPGSPQLHVWVTISQLCALRYGLQFLANGDHMFGAGRCNTMVKNVACNMRYGAPEQPRAWPTWPELCPSMHATQFHHPHHIGIKSRSYTTTILIEKVAGNHHRREIAERLWEISIQIDPLERLFIEALVPYSSNHRRHIHQWRTARPHTRPVGGCIWPVACWGMGARCWSPARTVRRTSSSPPH